MTLFLLLLAPVIIALVARFRDGKNVSLKEFFAMLGAALVVIGSGYGIAMCAKTYDTELWNGTVVSKMKSSVGCCHSYQCNCINVCTGTPPNQSCSPVCQTCYYHSSDDSWDAYSSNGEHVYQNGCNPPGSFEPERYTQIRIGEPTSVAHRYTNYIKASSNTIIKRSGAKQRFLSKLPVYPEIYDLYRADRLIPVGVSVPNLEQLNYRLSEINGELGRQRQVNIIVIVVNERDSAYIEGLTEAWIGGKKNDLVVVIGAPNFPNIDWVGVMSWTKNEMVKITIRDRIMGLQTFDGPQVLEVVRNEVAQKFVRRPMADFEYLQSSIRPPTWAIVLLFILGIALELGLFYYFHHHDPFGDARRAR